MAFTKVSDTVHACVSFRVNDHQQKFRFTMSLH